MERINEHKTKKENGVKTRSLKSTHKCCLCNKTYTGFGNNAQPLEDGRCCDTCNMVYVIPYRLTLGKRTTVGDVLTIINKWAERFPNSYSLQRAIKDLKQSIMEKS